MLLTNFKYKMKYLMYGSRHDNIDIELITHFINLINRNIILFIGFNTSMRDCYNIPKIKDGYDFYLFIEKLFKYSINKQKIVFFGHSYGITSAIVTVYILLRIINKIEPFNNNDLFESQINKIIENIDITIIEQICQLDIIIIGTGGTPNLFTTLDQYNNFVKLLYYYIHFVNYEYFINHENSIYDYFTYNLECDDKIYKNFKMYKLHSNPQNNIFFNMDKSDDEPKDIKLHYIETYIERLNYLLI